MRISWAGTLDLARPLFWFRATAQLDCGTFRRSVLHALRRRHHQVSNFAIFFPVPTWSVFSPETMVLGLCSDAIFDVSYDFPSCVGAWRVVIVIGLACQSNRDTLYWLRLLREACLWDCNPYSFSLHCHSLLVSTFTARLCEVDTHAASASNVSGSSRSWSVLGQNDGSTDTGSHGPGSSDDNRNTRRRLDTHSSTEDEQPRSGVKGITMLIDNFWEESNMRACKKLVRIHCKAGSVSVMLVFQT